MSGHCRCVNLSPKQDFPIDAPCPPLSLSYSSFHKHALSQGLGPADIRKIAEQCNLKAIEIITPGPKAKEDTNLPWWPFVVGVLIILLVAVLIIIIRRRKIKWTEEVDKPSIGAELTVVNTEELKAAKTDNPNNSTRFSMR